jgi:hypothetical protein
MNDSIISVLWASIEVSCEPPRVGTRCLLVLLARDNIGGGEGRMSIATPMLSLRSPGDTDPQTGLPSMGRPRILVKVA